MEVEDIHTLVFCFDENKFRGSDDLHPEGLTMCGNNHFSFKNGELWQQDAGESHNTFYGIQYPSEIEVVANTDNGKIKTALTVSSESNIVPTKVTINTTYPRSQTTEIVSSFFKNREGIFYASVLRDLNTPGTSTVKHLTGDRIRAPFTFIKFQFNTTDKLQLRYINYGYKLSSGHEFV